MLVAGISTSRTRDIRGSAQRLTLVINSPSVVAASPQPRRPSPVTGWVSSRA